MPKPDNNNPTKSIDKIKAPESASGASEESTAQQPPPLASQSSANQFHRPSVSSIKSQTQQQSSQGLSLRQQSIQGGPPLTKILSNSSHKSDRENAASSGALDHTLRSKKSGSGALDRKGSRRFKYSTDDDTAELEADYGRDYFEGYSVGLKQGRRRAKEASLKRSPVVRPTSTKDLQAMRHPSYISVKAIQEADDDEELTAEQVGESSTTQQDTLPDKGKKLPSSPHVHAHSSIGSIIHEIAEREEVHDTRFMSELQDELLDELESEDERSDYEDGDSASISSTETFTLRERQDAINITHPFGIRIWKPALYKKDRSVQRIAEGDIHSRPLKDVSWPVWVGNAIWSLTFGLLLFLVCVIAGISCLSIFWSSSSALYGRTLLSLGRYLLFPFGKCVQLWQDENYMWEDEGEGRTVAEYERWQTADIERGQLFFGPKNPNYQDTPSPNAASPSVVPSSSGAPAEPPTEEERRPPRRAGSESNSSTMSGSGAEFRRKRRLFGRGEWNIGRIIFYFWYYVLIMPLLYLISLICWLGVFSIPMAKVTSTIASHLRRHPLALSFRPASTLKNLSSTEYSSSILLCTYRALGIRYYKYTVDGTNIFFINLMFPVLFVIFDYYVLSEMLKLDYPFTRQYFIFFLALAAVIPLAYFIGQAVASISAQTSMGMGATINAFFSTIVEVFLYCVALNQGKGDLVEGSIVGSIFAGVLLLPGLSMCAGAIKRKTQRYNPKSAGVSSTMLLFAVIGAFAPTIFNQIYGTYELRCKPCDSIAGMDLKDDCSRCFFYQVPLSIGPLYTEIIKPFSYFCAILLFISYVIGLWFTLRTHAALIWQTPTVSELSVLHTGLPIVPAPSSSTPLPVHNPNAGNPASTKTPAQNEGDDTRFKSALKNSNSKKPAGLTVVDPVPLMLPPAADAAVAVVAGADHGGGHDAPNWSRTKSTVILLGATVLYAVIAEILVDNVDVVLEGTNISAKFLGITVFALVPNTTEFLNAISFAMNGNVSLSMEIGSAYALQVCLLQIPALVFYSLWIGPVGTNIHDFMFTLIFPRWDLFMVIFCVFVFSYIYAEGKSNYFKGSILVLSYLVVMMGFYFSGNTDEAGIMGSGFTTYYAPSMNPMGLSSGGPRFVQQESN